MNNEQKVEALLFVAGAEGISVEELSNFTGYAKPAILTMLDNLEKNYEVNSKTALKLIQTGGTYKLVTKPELASILEKYFDRNSRPGLSPAALEILSIAAYRQPITRIEINQIRGVQSGTTLQNLVLRNLVKVVGRLEEPGRPKTYGTTDEFLDYFGLEDIKDLPKLEKVGEDSELDDSDLFLQEFESKMNLNNKEK
ncbi:SMC-Scp complex subunit ScpB [Pediococcus pentosaceus]|uniref:SMC-Scp complex subunit ScpB n=1 Tax=Pediococcus pentosaceus TaxID=1255 RepID=UPI0018A18119|nr:SMC-Scp complex subunit ScpB [Pediococcus pentosaceus]MBF7128532.1 SMC-Scp complex subunit ScpB [Pediococcus pentosaceus]MBF7133257.1 SMC-Scp complex subunit ScpB [Pediococcus pentosaceus]